jgi:alkylated DNA repair dioxygenase AlkB
MARGSLFDPDVPSGFEYRDDFLTTDEEAQLADEIGRVEFSRFEMHGVAARRRVAFFGRSYDAGSAPALPLPPFLLALRDKVAIWTGTDAGAFAMALINEYPPGAPIGWHRDAPQYDIVAGLSLLSSCRMKFRPYVRPASARRASARLAEAPQARRRAGERSSSSGVRRMATHEIVLERRSAYLLSGEARNAFEHHIPPVTTLRYSITFRTLRS